MKLQDLHGACGFIADGISFRRLSDCIADLPGVAFTDRRPFFWGASDARAEFTFHGHAFKVWPDRDDSGIWIVPKDEHASPPEIRGVREHSVRFGGPRAMQHRGNPPVEGFCGGM